MNRARIPGYILFGVAFTGMLLAQPAHASLFEGETLDKVADVVSWLALIIAPITVISLFWMVHILPEKIAEKRKHPQTKAIQMLCLLSLAFGGLLWPVALLWAYSKPVLHKLAYGTDVEEHEPSGPVAAEEADAMRARIASLEAELRQRPAAG